jgi:hypothetical protein
VSVTSGPAIPPLVRVAQTGQPQRATAIEPSTPPAGEASHAPAQAPDVPAPSASPESGIGFSTSYDPSTGRIILEAREPGSGFVIYRMPPKYVIKQFTASVAPVDAARGATVDSAA